MEARSSGFIEISCCQGHGATVWHPSLMPSCRTWPPLCAMGAAMCAKRGGEGERWRRHEPRGCAPSRFEVDCWEAGPAGRGPDDWVWSAADANEQPWYEQICRSVLAHEAADYGGLRLRNTFQVTRQME